MRDRSPKHAYLVLAAALSLWTPMFVQAQVGVPKPSCVLTARDTLTTAGPVIKRCVELSDLVGKSYRVPRNTAALDPEAFALCPASSGAGDADIVYALDQSGSMNPLYVWISPDLLDTVFLFSLTTCVEFRNADIAGFGSLTIPNAEGLRTIPKLNPDKSLAGCRDFAGDPYTQRAAVFRQAIDYQAARAPGSTAGYLGFSVTELTPTPPLPLASIANVNLLKQAIAPSTNGGTDYRPPLQLAKEWLLNPVLTPHSLKAVIFLSDGMPNNLSYLPLLDATYPPIHGIFLGKPTPDTVRLKEMSVLTGGTFTRVEALSGDVSSAMRRILDGILVPHRLARATLANAVQGSPASATAADIADQPDGSWKIRFDKSLALTSGAANPINLAVDFRDSATSPVTSRSASFTLIPDLPEAADGGNLSGTPFALVCKDGTEITRTGRSARQNGGAGPRKPSRGYTVAGRALGEVGATPAVDPH